MHKLAFDHAVIYVPNLEKAISQFTALGFTIKPGGEHTHTHNALIIFNDRSYIELLALKPSWRRWLLLGIAKSGMLDLIANSKSDIGWRVMRWISYKYGPIDWALRTDNSEVTMTYLRENNIPLLDSLRYQRTLADGRIAEWTMVSAKDLDLPFLVADQTDIDLRVPLGEHTEHANGALGISKITVSAKDGHLAHRNLRTLLGIAIDQEISDKLTTRLDNTLIAFTKAENLAQPFSLELLYSGDKQVHLDRYKTFGTNIWLSPE